MNTARILARLAQQENLNFLLTNRIPRIQLTRFMGWFSKIEHPWVRDLSMWVWTRFADLDLSDALKPEFRSLHDCFTRELRPGARPIDGRAGLLTSPCDGIVGAHGCVQLLRAFQAKGFDYRIEELFGSHQEAQRYERGTYVTLRLTSSMYHRFHAMADCTVERVTYFSGDTWNVNPIALERIERLFCKNERVMLRTRLAGRNECVTLVAVAAVLVASVRLKFLDQPLNLAWRGPNVMDVQAKFDKGQEIGGFEHGSTIIVFAPPGYELADGLQTGDQIRMGQGLLRPADA